MVMVVVNDSALVRSLLLPRYAAVAASVSRIRTKGGGLSSALNSGEPRAGEFRVVSFQDQNAKRMRFAFGRRPSHMCAARVARRGPFRSRLCAFLLL